MQQFVSWEIAPRANHWAGRNVVRWANAEYDRLWQQAAMELDPAKCAVLFICMNALVIEDVAVIRVFRLPDMSAVRHSLRGLELGPWDWGLWNLAYWYRET
jgi:peptide/nickel transport system substrate-binding protein